MIGVVAWFSGPKGYGFVQDEESGTEYFAHFSSIQMKGYRELKQDQRVSFRVGKGPSGRDQAEEIIVLEDV